MPRQRQSKKDVGAVKGRKLSQPNSKTNSESKKSLNLSSPSRYDNNDSRKSLSSNRSGSTSNNIGGNKGRLKMVFVWVNCLGIFAFYCDMAYCFPIFVAYHYWFSKWIIARFKPKLPFQIFFADFGKR